MDGTVVRDMAVRFEGGRAVELTASTAQETMRTIIARDDGAARLGEVALVDDEGRIGALDTVFYDTLLDENAASHLALGRAFPFLAADEETGGADERVRHPHRLHDRPRRADASPASRPTASAFPCSSAASGRSEAQLSPAA